MRQLRFPSKPKKAQRLRSKIIFPVIVYILGFGFIGNVFMQLYLLRMILDRAERLDRVYLEAAGIRLDRNISDLFSLGVICANDPVILRAISRRRETAREAVKESLVVQDRLNAFLTANPVHLHIDKLILFNDQGIFAQSSLSRQGGDTSESLAVRSLPMVEKLRKSGLPWTSGFGRSIIPWNRRDSLAFLFRARSSGGDAYVYVEAGLDLIYSGFREFQALPGIFAQTAEGETIPRNGTLLTRPPEGELGYIPPGNGFPRRFSSGGRKYRVDQLPLENSLVVLYNRADITDLAVNDRQVLYIIVGALVFSFLAAVTLAIVLSIFITRPIRLLVKRIHKISRENDFSQDMKIEKPRNELGLIGWAVNRMSGSIERYLFNMEKQHRIQKRAELALLQTQINPHFLYNTLESIHWMAKLQKNFSVADTIRHLVNLLRNIAGKTAEAGNSGKITLERELGILEDYTTVMTLRFMGGFEVVNKIPDSLRGCLVPKLILQPLVENAIIHGIAPSGAFGTITLDAREEGGFLCITVEDTGVGMNGEKLLTIKTARRNRESPSLNNIGISNVNERLKLLYGGNCGLFFESRPGKFTRVLVKIPVER
ncbi:MAG: sensor histidine kinase [Treponema sp.]|jgi:two-component system sensor histidine kinase YesM|nr:sensor histidine kinase [Treponema sp.]